MNIGERTRSSRKGGKASRSTSWEVSPEATLLEEMLALSLKEREQQALLDIACIKLEDRVLQLEEKCMHLLLEISK